MANPEIDAVLFLIILGMAFVMMFASVPDRRKVFVFRILAVILFFMTALLLASHADVVFYSEVTDKDSNIIPEKKFLIKSGHMFLAWIMILLGLINGILVFLAFAEIGTSTRDKKYPLEM